MAKKDKKQVIVLAMHGVPPKDFPRLELMEYFRLSFKAEENPSSLSPAERIRLDELEKKMRSWPRNEGNDPFYAGSIKIARALASLAGCEVILGFNEFCSPSVEEALELACLRQPEIIFVLTPMLTPGGEHAAQEIPASIDKVKARHPEIEFFYAWPFEPEEIASFLLTTGKKKFDQAKKLE